MNHTSVLEAVKTWINAPAQQGKLSQSFTADRRNLAFQETEKSNELSVVVVPGPRTIDRVTRNNWSKQFSGFVTVSKKITVDTLTEETAAQDALIQLSEEIEQLLFGLVNLDTGSGIATRIDDIEVSVSPFSPEDLEDNTTFNHAIPFVYGTQVSPL